MKNEDQRDSMERKESKNTREKRKTEIQNRELRKCKKRED